MIVEQNDDNTKLKKRIKWKNDVYDPQIKRQCECLCCFGCNMNKQCKIFGKYRCNECNEWRCNKCYNDDMCKNCKKEY